MKKLTSLQILMLMSLAIGPSNIYGKFMDDHVGEAISLELRAADDEDAKLAVLEDLARTAPEAIVNIIRDEKDLEATFGSIRNFIRELNEKIERALEKDSVDPVEVAQWAAQAADAQENANKATARQRLEKKGKHKHEAMVNEAIRKAVRNLSILNKRAALVNEQAQEAIEKTMHRLKKSKASKAVVKASSDVKRAAQYGVAQAARRIPGVQDQVAQNLASKLNVSQDEAHEIINDTFEQEPMMHHYGILPHMQDDMNDDFITADASDDSIVAEEEI